MTHLKSKYFTMKKIFLLYISLLVISCNKRTIILRQNKNEYTKIEINEFNKIVSIKKIKNDSLFGQSLFFNKDKRIEYVFHYHKNYLDGINLCIYPSGFIDSYYLYKNGLAQGNAYNLKDSIIIQPKNFYIFKNNKIIYKKIYNTTGELINVENY